MVSLTKQVEKIQKQKLSGRSKAFREQFEQYQLLRKQLEEQGYEFKDPLSLPLTSGMGLDRPKTSRPQVSHKLY